VGNECIAIDDKSRKGQNVEVFLEVDDGVVVHDDEALPGRLYRTFKGHNGGFWRLTKPIMGHEAQE
jgi:hypothetical protein